MRGRDGEPEVIDCLGVGAVDGDLQYVVLVRRDGGAVRIVIVRDRVILAVYADLGGVGGVAEGNDAGDVGIEKFSVVAQPVAQEDTRCIRRVQRLQRACRAPLGEDGVQSGSDRVVVHALDGSFTRGVAVDDARVVELFHDRLVFLPFTFL